MTSHPTATVSLLTHASPAHHSPSSPSSPVSSSPPPLLSHALLAQFALKRPCPFFSAFFGEIPLLTTETGSRVRRRTVTGCTQCKLCFLQVAQVNKLIKLQPELFLHVKRISRFGKAVNKKGKKALQRSQDKLNEAAGLENMPLLAATVSAAGSDEASGQADDERFRAIEARMESLEATVHREVGKSNLLLAQLIEKLP